MVSTNVSFATTDTTKPVITVNPTSGSTVELGATVVISINDAESKIVSASYDLNGIYQKVTRAANHNWVINLTNFNIAGKTYKLVVTAENEAGLTEERVFTYYTKALDVTKPVVTANPASGSTLKLGSTVVISISDNESAIEEVTYDCNGIPGVGKNNGKKFVGCGKERGRSG
jgi:beta-lactam-binding protein with PASTA domain